MRKKIFILLLLITSSVCQAALNWEYWSPLTVTETITDIGGGDFRYEYSFENVDTSPIWHFGVYTNFTANSENLFTEYVLWDGPIVSQIDTLYPEYDARNLDSSINYMISGSANGGVDGYADNSIMPDEIASGFSFTSSVFNSSPKHYMYETIASGWIKTNGTGKVAAVGTTVPEPITISLFGFGALIILKRKK